MKNLFFIAILFLIFSCGGETKTKDNSAKTTSQPAKTEQSQPMSDSETPPSSAEKEMESLAKNKIKAKVKSDNTSTDIPAKNISAKMVNNSKTTVDKSVVKNEAEAKAQMETTKAKALSEKVHLEEEMKKVEKTKKAVDEKANPDKKKSTTKGDLHDEFDALLKKNVSSTGKVNYKGFQNDESKLDAYLKKLEKTNIEKSWSRNQTLAFWINAYNANTIKLILKNYPLKSIMDLNNGKPWDVKWIKIDQRTLSLNNIENDIIRPTYNEPRIHFAVNCAAKSCPPLLNKAWTADNLNSNLERQAKSFINDSNYNSISADKVEVSKIFDWYGKDFGDLKAYLNKYSSTEIGAGTSVNFKTYNWELNN